MEQAKIQLGQLLTMSSLIITEPLANALAVPEPAARYLLALFISKSSRSLHTSI